MGGGTNSALRGLLDEAEMSNTGLARAVVHAGAREGIHLGTDTTAVKRMLDGAQVTHLRQLDCRYGSGRTRVRVVQLLNHEANELLHGSYSEKIGRALLPAVAKAAWLAGFTAGDVGRHSLGQRYYIQALNLAMAGGDRLYAGYLLSQMSRMTQGIARGIVTEFDRVRHARQSVVLARAGLALTQGVATPLLVTQLHVAEGRGLALLGEVTATRRAMREAEQHHERVHPGAEPPWLSLYTDASLAADLGRCLRDIGEPDPAAGLITQAVDGLESWKVRNRCFVQIDLVSAHLLRRDWEQTAALGRETLRTATEVSSSLTLDGLRTLQRQLAPLRSASPHLTDLDARITDFLTSATRRQQHDAR